MRLSPLLFLSLAFLTGCPEGDDEDDTCPGGPGCDMGTADTGGLDAKPDAGDSGDTGEEDTGPADSGEEDAGGMDAADTGVMPGETLFPGTGVLVDGEMITLGTDTFDTVNTKLAGIPRMRQTADSVRSYEYTFTGYTVTIWYANTNLDDDGMAPMDVDGGDEVLWIAVGDGFPGTTPDDVGADSNRSDVESAYGPPPHTVDIANPAGTLAQYYTTGILVAYEPNDDVRTITISKAYGVEPNAEIDPSERRVSFGANEIQGSLLALPPDLGTDRDDVIALLGEPDVVGPINLGGQNLETLSYGFLGFELFFTDGGNSTIFFTIHPPFYGTTAGGLGMGTPMADFETYLMGLGFDGTPSTNPQLICYDDGTTMVGVTYSMTDNVVSSITLALPECP